MTLQVTIFIGGVLIGVFIGSTITLAFLWGNAKGAIDAWKGAYDATQAYTGSLEREVKWLRSREKS
jgi:hypothetical protein